MSEPTGRMVIFLSLVVALLLSIMPMPLWAQWGRPEWVSKLSSRSSVG